MRLHILTHELSISDAHKRIYCPTKSNLIFNSNKLSFYNNPFVDSTIKYLPSNSTAHVLINVTHILMWYVQFVCTYIAYIRWCAWIFRIESFLRRFRSAARTELSLRFVDSGIKVGNFWSMFSKFPHSKVLRAVFNPHRTNNSSAYVCVCVV